MWFTSFLLCCWLIVSFGSKPSNPSGAFLVGQIELQFEPKSYITTQQPQILQKKHQNNGQLNNLKFHEMHPLSSEFSCSRNKDASAGCPQAADHKAAGPEV